MDNKIVIPVETLVRKYLRGKYDYHDKSGTPLKHNRPSDYGRDFYTLYHKRIGTPYTNVPTDEGLGKMSSGDMFHFFVGKLLEDAGLLMKPANDYQVRVPEWNLVGHPDFLTGTDKPWDEVVTSIKEKNLPEWLEPIILEFVDGLVKQYPEGIAGLLTDLKTHGYLLFNRKFGSTEPGEFVKAGDDHAGQVMCYHEGLKNDVSLSYKPLPYSNIFYLCREDFRMRTSVVDLNDTLREKVGAFWAQIEKYVEEGVEPPIPQKIVPDEDEEGLFKLNWHVLYSPYLTRMYPEFKTKEDFKEHIDPIVKGMNAKIKDKREFESVMSLTEEQAIAERDALKAKKSYSSRRYRALKKRFDNE